MDTQVYNSIQLACQRLNKVIALLNDDAEQYAKRGSQLGEAISHSRALGVENALQFLTPLLALWQERKAV